MFKNSQLTGESSLRTKESRKFSSYEIALTKRPTIKEKKQHAYDTPMCPLNSKITIPIAYRWFHYTEQRQNNS